MCRVPVKGGFGDLSAPHWAPNWTAISYLMLHSYQKNERREYMRMWMRKEKEPRGRTSHAEKGPVPRWEWEWRTHLCAWCFNKGTLPSSSVQVPEPGHPEASLSLGGLKVRLCRLFTSLPLVQAVASSWFSQMRQNRVHSVPPSVVPAELKCGPLPLAAVCALGSLGPQTSCLMSSCVFRGHLVSCNTGPQFPWMLKEGIELGSLRSSSALTCSNSENWGRNFMCLN